MQTVHLLEWLKSGRQSNTACGEGRKATGTLGIAGGVQNSTAAVDDSCKPEHMLTVGPSAFILGYLPKRNEASGSHENLCVSVYGSCVHGASPTGGESVIPHCDSHTVECY